MIRRPKARAVPHRRAPVGRREAVTCYQQAIASDAAVPACCVPPLDHLEGRDGLDHRRDPARRDRRRGHPSGHQRGRRARRRRRAARRGGVRHGCCRAPPAAGLAGDVRHRQLCRRGRHRLLRRRPGPVVAGRWHPGRRGRPPEPSRAPPPRQVRSCRRGGGGPGGVVGSSVRRGQDPRRERGGDPGVDDRQAQRPVHEDQVAQPDPSPRVLRPGAAPATVSRLVAGDGGTRLSGASQP